MSVKVRELFAGIEVSQGWNEATMLHLTCCFIARNQTLLDKFRTYIRKIADEENMQADKLAPWETSSS